MSTTERILAEIDQLKREKPKNWKNRAKWLCFCLSKREDRFSGHEYHGTEFDGRKGLPMRSFEGVDYNDETVESEEDYLHE